ncbi:transcriptional regulator [Azorhizobium oxalatiphilum]|uniref:Transcriptional regulator n=1 Tax=Azorhizobium oxalatiphilum TaxID=980631 RepID=A0A917BU19_9HYPH|nr:AraC family transcriptional regulator [Azorhizobium oxalatiphilum]GGF56323.1 transcriptional regulator [Azorhizobium oxalatiphilum]
MTFQPRMTSRREGITLLEDLRWRRWNGAVADVWHAACSAGARGEYLSKDPRLFVVLERNGPCSDLKLSPNATEVVSGRQEFQLSYIPADMPLWSRTDEDMTIRHLDIHFDVSTLAVRLGEELDAERLATPRLRFSDERIMSLARMIAAECMDPDSHHELYGDGLMVALFIDLMQLGRTPPRKRGALAPWQLKRVTDFIEANCLRNIRLQELAELVELSQSYFSHAFKAATGLAPFQWHQQVRLKKVREMLANDGMTLTEIADAAGFADQAHLTRVFRRALGQTPGAWRRARAS